ncbi:hypothetical protein B1757_12895 [Acidithiobacillus marinus]|uniref:Uncharacterized protein n=1 Tax=Acidithiobacillus marinus TaxID=187490 RepID=A0A2I1DIZ1_9PROT|nr:hypothetical protein B1757_12895 [Acidithiobacillus marinus]
MPDQSERVICGRCQHFQRGKQRLSVGFCRLTMDRVTDGGRADRQGLPPDPNTRKGYGACYPMAPRICEEYQARPRRSREEAQQQELKT